VTPTPAGRQPGPVLAVALLAAGAVAWAAVPMSGARAGARLALVAAAWCAVASVARTATVIASERPGAARRRAGRYLSPDPGARLELRSVLTAAPWAQGLTVAVVVLEALHRPRPWHTVLLGVVMLGYLLALHLAESAAGPAALRPQLPLIIAGLGLAGLAGGAALLPATSAGAGWLSVTAALAAVIVAGLALPV